LEPNLRIVSVKNRATKPAAEAESKPHPSRIFSPVGQKMNIDNMTTVGKLSSS
jgi:hypothetical protein